MIRHLARALIALIEHLACVANILLDDLAYLQYQLVIIARLLIDVSMQCNTTSDLIILHGAFRSFSIEIFFGVFSLVMTTSII